MSNAPPPLPDFLTDEERKILLDEYASSGAISAATYARITEMVTGRLVTATIVDGVEKNISAIERSHNSGADLMDVQSRSDYQRKITDLKTSIKDLKS